MAYVDLALLQSYTRTTYDTTTTPTATDAQTFLDMSEAEVSEFTGRNWEQHTATETIRNPSNGLILLSDAPVISITSVQDEDGTDVAYEQIDRDFIQLTSSLPSKIIVTYEAGYINVPTAIQMLTILYWIRKVKQGESTTSGTSSSIGLGPISITNSIGISTIIGLSDDIRTYESRVRRLMR